MLRVEHLKHSHQFFKMLAGAKHFMSDSIRL